MITAFTVKNFKAIGEEPVRIELKPITLLFGANSAGKSSILHALHYAYEVFNNRNLNAKKGTIGSNSLDLGGFERFVHRNDLSRNIFIRFDFDNSYNFNDDYSSLFIGYDVFKHTFLRNLALDEATSSYVEIDIAWSQINNKPYVKRYETGFSGERMATINFDVNKRETVLQYLNIDHPLFHEAWVDKEISVGSLIKNSVDQSFYKTSLAFYQKSTEVNEIIKKERKNIIDKITNNQVEIIKLSNDYDENYNKIINNEVIEESHMRSVREQLFKKYGRIPPCTPVLASGEDNLNIILRQGDALPSYWDQPLRIDSIWKEFSENEASASTESLESRFLLNDLLTCVLSIPGQYISGLLRNSYHLGPLREIPPRHFSGIDPHDQSNRWRWATGLAAWDLLYWIGEQQLDSEGYRIGWSSSPTIQPTKRKFDIKGDAIQQLDIINDWLANKNRLNTGYQLIIERYREIPSTHPLLVALAEDQLLENISEVVKDIIHLPEKIRIWLQDESQNKLTLHEIGVGISQILPVVVAAVGKYWRFSLSMIEQPELHIHPAMQVQLADLFISQACTKIHKSGMKKVLQHSKSFLIETHSEHLLLRLLRRINETFEEELPTEIEPCTADDVAIYYLEKGSQGLRIRRLEISEDGDSKGDWPEGFFEERRAELF